MKSCAWLIPMLSALVTCMSTREPNTPRTNATLDLLTPKFRFGETLESLSRGGSIVEVDSTEAGSASANLRLASPRFGFDGLRVLGPKTSAAGSQRIVVDEFVFYAVPPQDGNTLREIIRALTGAFDHPPSDGCAGTPATKEEQVYVWEERRGGGGAALFVPLHSSGGPTAQPVRLAVYPGGKRISEVAFQFRSGPCAR